MNKNNNNNNNNNNNKNYNNDDNNYNNGEETIGGRTKVTAAAATAATGEVDINNTTGGSSSTISSIISSSSPPTILLQRRLTTILTNRKSATTTSRAPSLITINTNSINADDDDLIEDEMDYREVLIEKLVGDVVVASTVALGIAPFLTVIDQAVVQRISSTSSSSKGTTPGFLSMTGTIITNIIKNPFQYIRSPTFLWMWCTYASTYSAANTLRTLTTDYDQHHYYRRLTTGSIKSNYTTTTTTTTSPSYSSTNAAKATSSSSDDGVTSSLPPPPPTTTTTSPTKVTLSSASSSILFLGTTIINSTVSMLKDRAYAKLYGNTTTAAAAVKQVVPKISYGVWIGRDLTVIGSSFIVPSYVSQILHEQMNIPSSQSMKIAQLVSPVMAQIVATPFHMIGFDYYNRPTSILEGRSTKDRIIERIRYMRIGYIEVLIARMIRVIPGYGIGGVYNTSLRNQWNDYVHHEHHNVDYHHHTLFYGIFHNNHNHHSNHPTTPTTVDNK